MKHTGVFATRDETDELVGLIHEAQTTPVILLFGKSDLAGNAWQRAKQRVHALALIHGLPEIPGFYGFNGETGEFIE